MTPVIDPSGLSPLPGEWHSYRLRVNGTVEHATDCRTCATKTPKPMPDTPLRPGDPYRCLRCHTDHVIEQPSADRTTAERNFLYITCRGERYFVGQVVAEHPERR